MNGEGLTRRQLLKSAATAAVWRAPRRARQPLPHRRASANQRPEGRGAETHSRISGKAYRSGRGQDWCAVGKHRAVLRAHGCVQALRAVDYWNKQNPSAKVVDSDTPWNAEKQLAALSTKQGGPDLFQYDPQSAARHVGGKLLDLTDAVSQRRQIRRLQA